MFDSAKWQGKNANHTQKETGRESERERHSASE